MPGVRDNGNVAYLSRNDGVVVVRGRKVIYPLTTQAADHARQLRGGITATRSLADSANGPAPITQGIIGRVGPTQGVERVRAREQEAALLGEGPRCVERESHGEGDVVLGAAQAVALALGIRQAGRQVSRHAVRVLDVHRGRGLDIEAATIVPGGLGEEDGMQAGATRG